MSAIIETWLDSDNYSDYLLNDYEFCHRNRLNKKGGGVAIYVHKSLKYRILKNMSVVIDDIMESIKRNVIVSCIYRTLCSNVEAFNDQSEIMIK